MGLEAPELGRSLSLRLQGDWGMANLHRVCGWLSQEMGERTGPHSRFFISNGHGGFDAAFAVGRGEVDVALSTPAIFAKLALEGKGPFQGSAFPELRALGVLPQWDRLVVAVDSKFGLKTFDDLRHTETPLRIAVSVDDGRNQIGYATHRLLEAAGIDRPSLESRGWTFVEAQRPDQCLAIARRGEVDAIIQEAIMTYWWSDLMFERSMNLISLEPDTLNKLAALFGWEAADLPAEYFPGQSADVAALNYSDFIVLVRSDLPDDVARLLAWCLTETREGFEGQYRHIPPERSPVTYPLDPRRMAVSPIPLHPGAAAHYRAFGYL